jgi:RNA polymerase sigma-70 factor (ECF subfamily)
MNEVPAPAEEDDDPAEEMNALYRRALELVRVEFEERTWQMFWLVVVESRAPGDVAAEMKVTAGAVRLAKFRVLRRLKEEVGDVM